MTTRILIADNQALIRAGLRSLIESDPELEVVGEASTGREALRLVRATRADVVLMDIRMPDMDGLEATRAISADEDLAGVKVLILTTFEVDHYVLEALRAGAGGFLGKGAGPRELIEGIRTIARGDALLSATATRGLIARLLSQPETEQLATPEQLATLTPREAEVLTLVAAGLSNDDIAARLFVATVTVKTHVNRTMAKLHVRDRAQLVVIAYQSGLVGAPTPPARHHPTTP
ncbi:response regulator transcription factor [Streptomyces sp. NPDC002755]|uniref:response regulator transcription factor n=1 Tax=Streptomyces sp. NPDC002884 TaxID=3154544 RepID=UPI00332AEBC6